MAACQLAVLSAARGVYRDPLHGRMVVRFHNHSHREILYLEPEAA